jgi:hypothetical protein
MILVYESHFVSGPRRKWRILTRCQIYFTCARSIVVAIPSCNFFSSVKLFLPKTIYKYRYNVYVIFYSCVNLTLICAVRGKHPRSGHLCHSLTCRPISCLASHLFHVPGNILYTNTWLMPQRKKRNISGRTTSIWQFSSEMQKIYYPRPQEKGTGMNI